MVRTTSNPLLVSVKLVRALLLAIGVTLLVGYAASAEGIDITQLKADAQKGYASRQIELAAAYFTGNGVTQDAKQAAYWYQKAAEAGDPEAENEIGFFYQAGIGVPVDQARALHWYQLAAASGLTRAKVNLGVVYVWGLGVAKDEELAMQFFREAASRGDGAAASYLGDLYYFGIGVKQDKAAAETWYKTGAQFHDPVAAYNLGTLFSVDADHPHDLRKAEAFLRSSAADGYIPAIHSVGLLLVNHPDLATSPQEGPSLLETAASAGYWKSSVVLGALARDGKGVPADSKAAYLHFRTAVLQGGELAMSLVKYDLATLAKRLGTQLVGALDSDANTWYRLHRTPLLFVNKDSDKRQRFPASALAVSTAGLHAGQLLYVPAS
ncbi:tetratricopeptide repeat protein [Tunturiibacter gelidiferens]|uniref:Tetratricopeptide repeat protein n=1 Tax=Tunturiibacter gelidiferens TaxID=3069689 RepID=A0AAU7YWV9_9BACT